MKSETLALDFDILGDMKKATAPKNAPKILSQIEAKPYFQKDDFTLYHGDSIYLLQQMPENSVDMVFADPPYNLSNGGFTVHAGRMVSVNKGDWDVSKGFNDDYEFHYRWLEAVR